MSYLGPFGTLAIIYLFYILAKLSERLGAVQKMTPLYRYYFVAIFFLAVGFITQFVAARASTMSQETPAWITTPWVLLLAYHLPMAIGVSIGLFVSWKYWSWLVISQDK